jgi:phosphohistidine phosphatase
MSDTNMKTLLLMRHAKSSWKELGMDDHDRPLNKRGKHAAPLMGQLLQDSSLVPELIVSSTALRAEQTARRVAKSCGYQTDVCLENDLYHAGIEDWIDVVGHLPEVADRALLVGHNPGIEMFLRILTGQSVTMTTAALAHVQLPVDIWCDVNTHVAATLVDFWRPRELP